MQGELRWMTRASRRRSAAVSSQTAVIIDRIVFASVFHMSTLRSFSLEFKTLVSTLWNSQWPRIMLSNWLAGELTLNLSSDFFRAIADAFSVSVMTAPVSSWADLSINPQRGTVLTYTWFINDGRYNLVNEYVRDVDCNSISFVDTMDTICDHPHCSRQLDGRVAFHCEHIQRKFAENRTNSQFQEAASIHSVR